MIVLGCDPGTTSSALVSWDGARIWTAHTSPNDDILALLQEPSCFGGERGEKRILVIEEFESYGMAVGREVFQTIFWSGRFAQAFGRFAQMPRRLVKQHLCHTARATDSNIRQALIDRFGGQEAAIGKKKTPGPLYALKGHTWAAFAVAVTYFDQQANQPEQLRPGTTAEF